MARKKKLSTRERLKPEIPNLIRSLVFLIILITISLVVINLDENVKNKPEDGTVNKQINLNKTKEDLKNSTKLENQDSNEPKVQSHTVSQGENLSKIAEKYYGDKEKWTVIAAENSIENPNLINTGTTLKIPNLEAQTSSIATTNTNNPAENNQTANEPKTYTVVAGDTLWEISQQFYEGDGYLWFKIRDANTQKVGLLPNGRPLITPGTVLTIPNLN